MDELLKVLLADGRVAAAIVFGSAARGSLRGDSDFDVAVLTTDADARAQLGHELLETLGILGQAVRRDVHLVDLEDADPTLRRTVFATGRRLFDRSGGRLRDLETRTLLEYLDGEHHRRLIDAGQRRRLERALG